MIHCKRVYDPPTDDDGRRVLVDEEEYRRFIRANVKPARPADGR